MYLTLHRDVDPAPGVIVELSTTYIMPVYESEGIIRSKDLRRLMSPKRESSKREYCVPHHRACLHEQESQLNLLTCTLNSFLVIHLGQLLRSIFRFRLLYSSSAAWPPPYLQPFPNQRSYLNRTTFGS